MKLNLSLQLGEEVDGLEIGKVGVAEPGVRYISIGAYFNLNILNLGLLL